MSIQSTADLIELFRSKGAARILCKPLAENDNSKQQIYLGGSFEVLQQIPHTEVRVEARGVRPNYKAALDFHWMDDAGRVAKAPGAQLILYPDYPEVRLSGFLRGCTLAPAKDMQAVPKTVRGFNNGPDGRLLFLAVTDANSVLAYLATRGSPLAEDFARIRESGHLVQSGVFLEFPVADGLTTREMLLNRLRTIHREGWHASRRLDRTGGIVPYDLPPTSRTSLK